VLDRLAPEQWDTLPDIAEPREARALFGHDAAGALVARRYRAGTLHHALLLSGARGIGKATFAFRLAGHVLAWPDAALAPETLTPPPPDSPLWRQIAGAGHPGLLHLARPADDKRKGFRTAITVDEVRRVSRFVGTTQHDGGWRVVIVDAADDLNTNAANALLKSLEEPPPRTLFVLVAHAPGRLLATIRSRCQPLRLMPLAAPDLARALAACGAAIAPDELPGLAALSGGSVREALLLAMNGGLELAGVIDAILARPGFDAGEAMRLADAVGGRDDLVQFDLVNRLLLDRVAATARGRASAAAARLWQEARATIDTAATYNLDRRQHVAGLLRRLHEAGIGRS